MKNKLLLLSLLFVVLLSMVVFAPDTGVSGTFGKVFEKVLKGVEGIIGSLFTAVSKSPFVWLRFLLFVVIFAVLHYSTKKLQMFDDKTSAIVSFVISFATVAITPAWLLVGVVSVYGGLILLGLIVLPLFFLVNVTRTARKNRMNLFFLFLMWAVFAALVASINQTTDTIKGPFITGPILQGPFIEEKAIPSLLGVVETVLEFIVLGSVLTALVLLIWFLFSGTSGAAVPAGAAGAGGGFFDKWAKPLKYSFKKFWEPTLAQEFASIANIRAECQSASKHTSDFKDYLKNALNEVNTLAKTTSDIKNRIGELLAYKDKFTTAADKAVVGDLNSFAKSMSSELKQMKKDLTDASNEANYAGAKTSIDAALDKLNEFETNLKALEGLEKKLESIISP